MQAGSVHALAEGDWIFPSYRESAIGLLRGMPASTVLHWWRGHPAGWWNPADYRVASICVPIATHVPHAAGLAWGEKLKGNSTVAIAYFGDGATSEGAFHEGANFAAVMQAPLSSSATTTSGRSRRRSRRRPRRDARRQGGRLRDARRAGRRRRRARRVRGDARGGRARARGRRADVHRGRQLPRRAARDRRRPARVHRPRPRRGGEAQRVRRPLRGLSPAARRARRRDGGGDQERGARGDAARDRRGRGRAGAGSELVFDNAYVLPPPDLREGWDA